MSICFLEINRLICAETRLNEGTRLNQPEKRNMHWNKSISRRKQVRTGHREPLVRLSLELHSSFVVYTVKMFEEAFADCLSVLTPSTETSTNERDRNNPVQKQ